MNKLILIPLILIITSIYSFSQFHQTFCRHGLNIPILNHGITRDSMLVNVPADHRVTDVNFLIDTILHTWDSDLRLYVQHNGIGAKLLNNIGGSGDNFIGTMLNDSAAIALPNGFPPFTGTYRPYDSLSRFNNSFAAGYWRILITDTATGDTGVLKAWCLVISHTNVSGIEETTIIPNTYRLYQNYPNPFNPVTKIRYGLPKKSFVKLSVFNSLGQEAAVLVNGIKDANTYEVVFDATNLPSGVYYYKLEADGFSDIKKMVIVK